MNTIVPAILTTSREDLEEKLEILYGGVANGVNGTRGESQSVQIDVIDGRFVPALTWPYTEKAKSGTPVFSAGDTFPYLGQLNYEIDLMVSEPERVIGGWIDAGASRITIHAESVKDLSQLITHIQFTYGHAKDFAPDLLSIGLAINISTDTALIEPFLEHIDYVQFMGIAKIGQQGEAFDPRVLRKITVFRLKHPTVVLQVDGGVSLTTAPQLLQAGVSRLIVGSAIWKAPNSLEEIQKFMRIAQEFGAYS